MGLGYEKLLLLENNYASEKKGWILPLLQCAFVLPSDCQVMPDNNGIVRRTTWVMCFSHRDV